jgi:ribonuclease P protein component
LSQSKVLARFSVLRTSTDFEAVLRSGLRVSSRNFVIRARVNSVGHTRVGIIAGRKAAPRAVDRNRGKRLIREVFRGSSELATHDVTVQLRTNLRAERNITVRTELLNLILSLARRCATTQADGAPERTSPTPNRQ